MSGIQTLLCIYCRLKSTKYKKDIVTKEKKPLCSRMMFALTISHMLGVEPVQEGIRFSPLTTDHHILPGLVPEVIAKGSGVALPLPCSLHFKTLPIQQDEPPCKRNGHRRNTVSHKSLSYNYMTKTYMRMC